MKLEIYKRAPDATIIDICHDVPAFNPEASSRLLQALVKDLPDNAIVLAVVDPGVGTDRHPLWLEIDGKHFIGPDNGLFGRIVSQANQVTAHIIEYEPANVSATFHGRDVFAPFAADLENKKYLHSCKYDNQNLVGINWPQEQYEVIYIDHYGNAITGISATSVCAGKLVSVQGNKLCHARTFAEVEQNQAFWFENSFGLIEIGARNNSAAKLLDINLGTSVEITN